MKKQLIDFYPELVEEGAKEKAKEPRSWQQLVEAEEKRRALEAEHK